MNIPIPKFLHRVFQRIHPQSQRSCGPLTQAELPFDQPTPPFEGACDETPNKIRLNLAERDSSRLLTILEEAFADAPLELTLELIGPGILLHDNALMLFEEIRNRPSCTRLHVRARTCLMDGAILLWLAGDTRSMRADTWIQISALDSVSHEMDSDSDTPPLIEDEAPATTDLRTIHNHINEWLPVRESAGLRLFESELREFGLLDDSESTDQLVALFQAELPSPAPELQNQYHNRKNHTVTRKPDAS